MDDTSTNLKLPYLQAAQAQKHVTHNAALERLDLIVQLSLQSFAETTPPVSPDEGQVWAVAAGAVNDWAGQDGTLAAWSNGGWLFLQPLAGWRAVMGEELRLWDGSAWVAPDLPDLQNLPGLGINASHDATNRLALSAPASLFNHEGAGHQLKLNKAAAGDTGSLLFQTNWSGRAEMGTLGSDAFAIKVSADGSSWTTALGFDPATGLPGGAALTQSPLDETAGRLMKVGDFGLGPAGPALADFDDAVLTGFYRFSTTTPSNAPLAASTDWSVLAVRRNSADAVTQLAFDTAGARTFLRYAEGGSWGDWAEIATQARLIGPVSQAGGIPTGG